MKKFKIIDRELLTIEDESGKLSLFSLTIPIFFQNIFNVLLGTINTLMLTKASEDAVTAVNVANVVIDIPLTILNMITSGTVIILSLYLGAGKREKASKVFVTSVVSAAAISALISLVLYIAAKPVLGLMNVEGEILNSAALYFKIRIAFLVFTALTNCITAVLRAYGSAKPTMISGLIANAVNALLSAYVVSSAFSGDKIIGVAYAAVIGQALGMLYSAVAYKTHKNLSSSGGFSAACLGRILSVGIPSGMSLFAFSISSALSTSIVASLGQMAVNVKIYTYNISRYTYILGYALAQASCLLIGRYTGGGRYDEAKRLFKSVGRIIIALNFLLSTAVFIFSTPLMKFFTKDSAVIAMAGNIFLIDIVIEMARGNTHIGENALCSVADTVFTSAVSCICCFCISTFGCWLFCTKLGFSVYGFYIASLTDEFVRGMLYRIRWNKGRWILSVQKKI